MKVVHPTDRRNAHNHGRALNETETERQRETEREGERKGGEKKVIPL